MKFLFARQKYFKTAHRYRKFDYLKSIKQDYNNIITVEEADELKLAKETRLTNRLHYPTLLDWDDLSPVKFFLDTNPRTVTKSWVTYLIRLETVIKEYNESTVELFYMNDERPLRYITSVIAYILSYNYFIFSAYFDIFYFSAYRLINNLNFYLVMTFRRSKLYINFQGNKKKDYFFLSSGLFLRVFANKKAIKKSKTIKLLMAKYLRKLFLVLQVRQTICIVKKTPSNLLEIFRIFNEPIIHKFTNPVTGVVCDELTNPLPFTSFPYFLFLHNQTFAKNKIRKLGRVKRKIARKVINQNRIVD